MSQYMTVNLTEITKKEYYDHRKPELMVGERPLGFIAQINNERHMFIAKDNKFYRGPMLAYQTVAMFKNMQFRNIRVITRAEFEQPEVVKTEPVKTDEAA